MMRDKEGKRSCEHSENVCMKIIFSVTFIHLFERLEKRERERERD